MENHTTNTDCVIAFADSVKDTRYVDGRNAGNINPESADIFPSIEEARNYIKSNNCRDCWIEDLEGNIL